MKEVKYHFNCPSCSTRPGHCHITGICDVERCSVCGNQAMMCWDAHGKQHDPTFARWTGFWPGELESKALGVELNEFYRNLFKLFFVRPNASNIPKSSYSRPALKLR
jgi:hypothetical protein